MTLDLSFCYGCPGILLNVPLTERSTGTPSGWFLAIGRSRDWLNLRLVMHVNMLAGQEWIFVEGVRDYWGVEEGGIGCSLLFHHPLS